MVFISPSDYVNVPVIEAGEREIDFKYGIADLRPPDDQKAANSVGFGLGVNAHWFTEIYFKWEQNASNGQHFDAMEWENRFVFTEPGEYPFDLGLATEIERPKDRTEGYEISVGPLFQTKIERWQINANLKLTRSIKADEDVVPQLGYQFQLKYRLGPQFEPGIQAIGQVGDATHWSPVDQQAHSMGPAAFGVFHVGDAEKIRYNAAWLVGLSGGSPRNVLRVQVEYEF